MEDLSKSTSHDVFEFFTRQDLPDVPVFIFRIGSKPILSTTLDVFEFFMRQDLPTLKVLTPTTD